MPTDYVKAHLTPTSPYHREALRLEQQLRGEATYRDGVVRWASNSRVPFEDVVALAVYLDLPVDAAKCSAARSADNATFIATYRATYKGPSAEERAEARAAHGAGVRLVNVVAGHAWTT